ncbi:MAG: carbohydrate ABC transporter permease [Kiritimatiellia bacterium]|nr:carbohydrate ABC transporter permease [Lentisphaerota bacterium]
MNSRLRQIAACVLALLGGLVFLFPLLWMLRSSLLPHDQVLRALTAWRQLLPWPPRWENYAEVFRRVAFARTLLVSLGFTGVIVVVGMVINAACAYAFARLRLPGGDLLFAVVAALIIIPFEALALPLFIMLGVHGGLMNSLPGLFLPYLAKAFNIFLIRQYFLSLPAELEEAARVEGASWFRIFFQVALPLAKPVLAACAVLDFMLHWSEYLWPLIMTNRPDFETIQLGLGHFYTLPPIQWGGIMAYSVMATLPMMLVFAFFQRYLVLSMATAGLKQ